MKLLSFSALALVSSFALASVGCAAPTDTAAPAAEEGTDSAEVIASQDIRASSKEQLQRLSGLWNTRNAELAKGVTTGLTLRVLETGGGDPALNGNYLWLAVIGEHGEASVFELDLNIAGLDKVELTAPGVLHLKGTQDTIEGESGDVKNGLPFEATVRFAAKDDAVPSRVKVESKGQSHDADKNAEASAEFLGSIYQVDTKENETVIARTFLSAVGDPAMNGAHVHLSLMAYPEERTYELGLNVASVTKISFASKTRLRIEGTEDTMDAGGNIKSRPFAYAVRFSVGQDGIPSEAVKLQRLAK
jgi:hypothetical protein